MERGKEPSSPDTAKDPILFAGWVNEYCILSKTFEDDLNDLTPSEEQCNKLNISKTERNLCANEYVLLRALGACLFVRNNFDEAYYLSFRNSLMPQVVERMSRYAPYGHHDNPIAAIDSYLEELKDESGFGFSMMYLDRVYPDTPNSGAIIAQGIPIQIALSHAMLIFDVVRDGYCKLSTGMNHDMLQKINKLIEDEKENI